jgi:hypothetical protein
MPGGHQGVRGDAGHAQSGHHALGRAS